MSDSTSPPPERKPYQNWRSQQSTNWRLKDETPRTDPNPRNQQRPYDQRRENAAPQSAEATPGTRLYVGNLLYSAQGADVEQFFADHGFVVTHINMSTDPFTGRNPSYCFVDLETMEEATRAMTELNGREVLGRPVKINPGVKKAYNSTPKREWGSREGTPTKSIREYVRWGSETRRADTVVAGEYKPVSERWSRTTDNREGWTNQLEQSKRLYVGGLPKIEGQSTVDAEMHTIFEGFEIESISKIISPHPSKAGEPGNHFYLFVDVISPEEAERAIEALDGKEMDWGGKLRVNRAKGDGRKVAREQRVTLDDFSKLRVSGKDDNNAAVA